MTPGLIILLIWIACGVAAYGFIVAHFCGEFPEANASGHRWLGALVGIMGPFGIAASFFATAIMAGRPFKHGWKL